jgi:hypothetical protein
LCFFDCKCFIKMKRILSVLLVCLYSCAAPAQKDFEGEIVYAVKLGDKPTRLTIELSEYKTAMNYEPLDSQGNISDSGTKIIYDYKNGISYIVSKANRTVMVDSITMKTFRSLILNTIPSFKKTGNTKKIAGYDCNEMVDSSSSESYNNGSVWVCEEFTYKAGPYKTNTDFLNLFANRFLMLEATSPDKKNPSASWVTVSAISVTPKSIPASVFEIDPGYKIINISEFTKGLKIRYNPNPYLGKKNEKTRVKPHSKRKQ